MHLARFVVLMLVSVVASAAAPPGMPDRWSDGYVYANGIRIHYYRAAPAPGKPVMVMAHGVTDNGLCWTTLSLQLQDAYDIYMVDARGHGLSDPFTPADDGDTLAKDLVAFVRAMKFDKPILMGHSMGAATVLRVGAQYPDLARAVVMLDGPLQPMIPPRPPGGGSAPPQAPQGSAPDRLAISMLGSPETLVTQNNYKFDDLVATCRRQTPKWQLADCQYWALSKKQYHGAYTDKEWQAVTGMIAINDSLTKISAPALFVKADAPPERRKGDEQAVKVVRNGKLVHLDGTGHNLHHDDLNRTVEVVTQFLSKR